MNLKLPVNSTCTLSLFKGGVEGQCFEGKVSVKVQGVDAQNEGHSWTEARGKETAAAEASRLAGLTLLATAVPVTSKEQDREGWSNQPD